MENCESFQNSFHMSHWVLVRVACSLSSKFLSTLIMFDELRTRQHGIMYAIVFTFHAKFPFVFALAFVSKYFYSLFFFSSLTSSSTINFRANLSNIQRVEKFFEHLFALSFSNSVCKHISPTIINRRNNKILIIILN